MAFKGITAWLLGGESGGGGGDSDKIWKPTVTASGNISWQKSTSTIPPATQNIKGEKGDTGATGPQGPKGDTGEPGEQGESGISPSITITEITGGHRVTITDEEHPEGQSFDVMDGEGGSGSGDMKKSVYDANSEVQNAGGIAKYVSSKQPQMRDGYLIIS